jgi:Kef-type K+ transport system membrane component KefB
MARSPKPGPHRLLIHGLIWALCWAGIGVSLRYGRHLTPPAATAPAAPSIGPEALKADGPAGLGAMHWRAVVRHPGASLGRLILQIAVVLVATGVLGALFRKIGLPAVVGEVMAGILLGPSLFGWLWPGGFAFLFTGTTLDLLRLLSQVGVAVYLFAIGMDLEADAFREGARSAFVVSQTGIAVPFLFGVVLALGLFAPYAGAGASFPAFALLMGIALSITAFPVLARIVEDRGLSKTPLGVAALNCAAFGDAGAWAILAFVVAFARAQPMATTVVETGLLAAFVALMLVTVRRRLPRWLKARYLAENRLPPAVTARVLLFLAASALVTELLGIHALFGAFLAGAILPRNEAFRHLARRLERVSRTVLLPLFFAFSGLRTYVGALDGIQPWLVCLAIIVVATLGKFGSTMAAARLEGMGWRDAMSFGALMNTRGLMELIALNIGYDLGILSPSIFVMLVLMALVTTFMTGPLLDLIEHRYDPGISPLS